MATGSAVADETAKAGAGGAGMAPPMHAAADTEPQPTYAEVDFAHPVSLDSAITVTQAYGLEVQGYHFSTDSIVGDYWPDAGLTVDEFLSNVRTATATAPEVVSAYVVAGEYQNLTRTQRGTPAPLGAELPPYDAPDADASLAVPPDKSGTEGAGGATSRAAGDTWQPVDAQVMIQGAGDTLSISAKYAWYGLSPYASPLVTANHWGMEFQFDFYTQQRPLRSNSVPFYNYRPWCGDTAVYYKDWAAASTRPYSWFGWVISGPDYVSAPGSLGLYGDFNDASDPCNVSTVAIGMAQPTAMPNSYGDNFLDLYLYPLKGDDTQSTVGAIVQPVSRTWCELNPTMPLMDCMGVTPGAYPGPGPSGNRMVLNNTNNRKAPDLCWFSGNFGTVPADIWSCN